MADVRSVQIASSAIESWNKDGTRKYGDKRKILHSNPAAPAAKGKAKPKKAAPAILTGNIHESESEAG